MKTTNKQNQMGGDLTAKMNYSYAPEKVRKISPYEMVKMQNRYAYETEFNNYTRMSYKDYKEWYDTVIQFVD